MRFVNAVQYFGKNFIVCHDLIRLFASQKSTFPKGEGSGEIFIFVFFIILQSIKNFPLLAERENKDLFCGTFLHTGFGRCEGVCEDDAEKRNDALSNGADEKQDLRAGERISENGKDIFSHKARERCSEHHAEEGCHVGNDGVEREIIRSVFIGQIEIRQRGHDRARGNAEDVLRESDHDIEPDGVRRYERIRVIRDCMDDQYDRERTEPIMP